MMDLPARRFMCWLVDLSDPSKREYFGEDIGVASSLSAYDAMQAACWYAEEYDLTYGTENLPKPLRIGTVEVSRGTPKLVEVHLQADPGPTWYAAVADEREREAFAVTWWLIQIGLWGELGETRAEKLERSREILAAFDGVPDNTNGLANSADDLPNVAQYLTKEKKTC
jgi:hypothetical protein